MNKLLTTISILLATLLLATSCTKEQSRCSTCPDADGAQAKDYIVFKSNIRLGAYSNSDYWITFAGIAPADDPRFVVAVMLDDPERGPLEGGGGGQSSAPIFTEIANWLINRENIAQSPDPGEPMVLQAQ